MINKRTLPLILFTLIITLTFKTNVYAAQELTCLYSKSSAVGQPAILTQDKKGNRAIYLNQNKKIKEYKIDSQGWQKHEGATSVIKMDKKLSLDSNSNLKACPKAIIMNAIQSDDTGKTLFTFYEVKLTDSCSGNKCSKLQESKSNLEEPKVNGAGNDSTKDTNGKTCTGISKEISGGSKKYWATINKATLDCLYCREVNNKIELFQASVLEPEISTSTVRDIRFIGYDNLAEYFQSYTPTAYQEDFKSGDCPVVAKITELGKVIRFEKNVSSLGDKVAGTTGSIYTLVGAKGTNFKTGLSVDEYKQEIIIDPKKELKSCDELFEGESGKKLLDMIITARKIIQIGVPILLIAMGIVDFVNAIVSMNEDAMKKAQNKFIKRLIVGVIFFLIPNILNVILGIASKIWPKVIVANSSGSFFCGII